ncbi:MAG: bifunctional nuclease family protein [Elusimicrobiales bacterium]|nr:bifunctional nuclease family protein [Elusimicrobiales bacterium]
MTEPLDKEVKIYSIATSLTESIIFLDESDGSRILPIWIGPAEAQAIAIRLSGYPSPRPMTHDLLFSMIRELGYTLEKVAIRDITDNTYYSLLHLSSKDGSVKKTVDARPSDAIAMAVRFGCPIYISEAVFSKTQVLSKPITEDEVVKFREDLKNLKPNDIISQLLKEPGPPGGLGKGALGDRREEEEEEDEGEDDDEQA